MATGGFGVSSGHRPRDGGPTPAGGPGGPGEDMSQTPTRLSIRTPDQRVRVFVSSTLQELAPEREAARTAIQDLRLIPVMFESGARAHPPRALYTAYLDQSDLFLGIYWQSYGYVAPGEAVSGLEDEYLLAGDRPKLLYLKQPAPDREPLLDSLIQRMREGEVSYKKFATPAELRDLIENDLALLLTERFVATQAPVTGGKADSAPRHNLPRPPTALIGREAELAAASSALLQPDTRLVTLTGPGGAGKTRLALELAADLVSEFADGVFLVDLSPLDEPAKVVSAIAAVWEVRETGDGRPPVELLVDYLRTKCLLLVLDNFEQVVAAAPVVAELLAACPRLRVLATSRIPLRVRAEHELAVGPLAFPGKGTASSGEGLREFAAVDLFVHRALDVRPDYAIDDQSLSVAAEICRRLDGLPLAIELAAARLRLLTAQAMLDRLDRRLPLLVGGARDLPLRQRTLRSTIAWSYELLDEPVKQLFRRLSVFVGGWALDAAEAICAPRNDLDLLDGMEALVQGNLVRQTSGSSGEPRFGMLETIREFGLELLSDSGEVGELRGRHARYFLALAEQAEPHLPTPDRTLWLPRVESELDNLRAALAWYTAAGAEEGVALAASLGWFWFFRGLLSEGRDWMERTLGADRPRTLPSAKSLMMAGGLAWAQGDRLAARSRLEESVAMSRALGPAAADVLAQSLMLAGFVHTNQADHVTARALHEESQALSREAGHRWLEALSLSNLGDATLLAGDGPRARGYYDAALVIFEQLDDAWGRAIVQYALGTMALYLKDYDGARAAFQESAALSRMLLDRWSVARSLLGWATAELNGEDVRCAENRFKDSLALQREIGNTAGQVMCLAGLAATAAASGRPARAARLYGAAEAMGTDLGSHLWPPLRAAVQRRLALARSPGDEADWDTACAEGRSSTLDSVVAEALELADGLVQRAG